MGKRIKNLGGCRGDGSFYAKLKIQDAWPDERLCAHVSAVVPSASIPTSLPASIFPTDDPQIWVLQIPLLDAKEITVDVVSQDPAARHLGSITFNYEKIKWESRINYRLRKELCAEIRDYERGFTQNRYQPQIMRYLEGDDSIIWRTRICWQGSPETKPELQVLDGVGNPIAFTQYFFEFQESVDPDMPHALFVSIELPVDQRYFTLVASDSRQRAGEGVASAPKQGTRENATSDPKEQIQPGFCAINPGAYEAFKYETWKYMKDARADDAAYQQWFKTHCATKDELARQRLHQFAHEPLISVIVPCFNSQERYLKELLDSVVAQSYPHWELLLVDATCATSDVPAKCAEEYSRKLKQPSAIRHLPLGGEGNIVTNTNYGIEQAHGEFVAFLDHDDLLEPDAIYSYVEAINNHPNATLLYCDEGLFEKAGTYIQPAFKSKINVDLLYSHNYVTHFLMVRRAALLEEGLSDDAVSGAQDYDVTLKMVRRALASSSTSSNVMDLPNTPLEALDNQLIHIPRILYHWRIHEESTSTGNKDVKPYAERAGQIALQRHLDARNIAACVETTNTPFVYRVRYDLPVAGTTHPIDDPIVSIVISSKDHVDVLDACITSIVERSTFSQFEIIVVENNSVDPETFEYYQRLLQYDPRIRVVQWPQRDGNFNYSALINFGASQAQGDYLLLLNNDTEVITPDWIEEMVGYLQRPEVGVVGAKLYFRDHLTQHAGMEVGPFDAVVHVNQDFSSKREGYLAKAVRPGNFSSVTGACQMVSHSLFDELSGYDEALAVGFNDVDFCLRVQQAGYLVTFTPYAELYHYEFVSRGREVADPVKQARWEKERDFFMARWPESFEYEDPYGNPNLKRNNAYYALGD
ncbi:MAG: glycosyltransferase family 2 protein [Eggerthellaceae bacterium]|nr:glycosyltransferase family 2 protein [Eggerthellaceae bacterium]